MSTEQKKELEPQAKRPRIEAPVEASGDASYEVAKLDADKASQLFEKLEEIQKEIDSVNEKASEEVLEVERKYNKIRKPLHAKRSEISEQLPQFWMTALMNHGAFSEIVTEEEEECLRYLTKLEVEDADDIKSGTKITFHFNPNRFFENSVIVKDFHTTEYEATCETTEIKWKIDRPRGKKDEKPSFFGWLEDIGSDRMDLVDTIREDIWPNPIHYYAASNVDAHEGSSDSSSEEEVEGEGIDGEEST